MLRRFLLLPVVATGLAVGAVTFSSSASASLMTWSLANHPNGSENPPPYGLRLDGLYSGVGSDVWSFDFARDGTDMTLTFDHSSQDIRIFGTVYGGRTDGDTYVDSLAGLWSVDFTYKGDTVSKDGGEGLGFTVAEGSANVGSITPLFDATVETEDGSLLAIKDQSIDLRDKASSAGFSFKFNNTTDHRLGGTGLSGPDVFAGWGWLNHSVVPGGDLDRHIAASDWLFTATRVPAPATLALFGLGLLLLGARRSLRAG